VTGQARTPGLILRAQQVISRQPAGRPDTDPALQAAAALYQAGMLRRPVQQPPGWLTATLLQVLIGIARGESNEDTGTRLHCSANAIKMHRKTLYRRMRVASAAHAAGLAMARGWVRAEHVLGDGGDGR